MIDLEQVKRTVSMAEVLGQEGIEVRRGWAVCPFHADTHPSMKVYPDGFYCFACGAGGDVISFYARLHGLKNGEAARALAEGRGLRQERFSPMRAQRRQAEVFRRQRRLEEYDRLCARLRAARATVAYFEPYCEHWCRAVRTIPLLEDRLDELEKEIG